MPHAHRIRGPEKLVGEIGLDVHVEQSIQWMPPFGPGEVVREELLGGIRIGGRSEIVGEKAVPERRVELMQEPVRCATVALELEQRAGSLHARVAEAAGDRRDRPPDRARKHVEVSEEVRCHVAWIRTEELVAAEAGERHRHAGASETRDRIVLDQRFPWLVVVLQQRRKCCSSW